LSLFNELKRRNVVRVAIAYAVASWVLLQIADLVLENIAAPPWVIQAMMLVILLGFVAAVVIAWAYELTPEGVKRQVDIDRDQSITAVTGHKLDRIIIGFLALAVVYFVYDKSTTPELPLASTVPLVAEQAVDIPEPPTDPSIAVLPFVNMSTDAEQEFFSDGISEELLNLLVKVDGLKVASRTSSFIYKGSSLSLADIAGELRVDHVLEGSVRKSDNRVRITAQLIDAASDRHLWSDTYDRELTDIFGIQDEIANAIVSALRTELGVLTQTEAVSADVVTENLDAYQLYLKARGLFLARAELETAVALFEQAVALDPEFARAWESLAANYSVMESWGYGDRDYAGLTLKAAQKALDIDPTLSTPWAAMSQGAADNGDMITNMEYMNKAIELDPDNATHYLWRGINFSTLGFQRESVENIQRCLELDPAYENCRRHLSFSKFILNENESGLRLFQEGAERGFNGSNFMFMQRLLSLGERMLVTQLVWTGEDIGSLLPGKEILDAMEFPKRDHSQGLAKTNLFVESSQRDFSPWPLVYAIFKAYHQVEVDPGFPRWIWLDENAGFRQSGYFKPYLEEIGAPAFWREHGFPPNCRPLGDEDFECD
jgi:TolB-like protein/Tfp pilus assembly protein PilF